MKKPIFVLTFIFLCSVFSIAQSYMTAGGLRMGTDWGLTLQQRLSKNMTFEGILQSSLQREEFMLTALVERHYALIYRGLNLYAGAGLHKGFLSNHPTVELVPRTWDAAFGLTFIGGAELTLGRFNLSYDFKPAINIAGGQKKVYAQTGISLRYVFLTNKHYRKIQKKKRKKKRKEEGGFRLKWPKR